MTTPATVVREPCDPQAAIEAPELADISFRLVPKPRMAVPVLNRRFVLLGIVLFQPEPFVATSVVTEEKK